jgi:predicted transcriptional regulator
VSSNRRVYQGPPPDYYCRAVLECVPGLQPRQKLVCIGILVMAAALRQQGEPATIGRIAGLLGAEVPNLVGAVKALVRAGILTKIQIPNRLGKGRAYDLRLANTPLLRECFGIADE